jgi:uncharacterized protein (TIGR02246 family)
MSALPSVAALQGKLAAVLGAALLLAACEHPHHREAAIKAIGAADSAFARATTERGADGWAGFFAHDGVMMIPGSTVVGRAAIRSLMTPELADTTASFTWHPVTVDAADDGDLGYSIGRWDRAPRAGGGKPARHGSYVTVWRKQGDGTWKVVLDIGNADPRR